MTLSDVSGALLGLVWGSFVGVLVDRIPAGGSPLGRSRCGSCGRILGPLDLVPVVSWFVLRGRCRTCRARFSGRSTAVELACGVLGWGAVRASDGPWAAVLLGAAGGILVGLAIIDLEVRRLPNAIVYPSAIAAVSLVLLGAALGAALDPATAAVGAATFGGGLLAIALVSRGGMGMGDVKLAGLIGWVLGAVDIRAVAVAAAAAIVLGGMAGIVALLRGASRRDALPFGPMLAAGAIVGASFGPRIADAYLGWLR